MSTRRSRWRNCARKWPDATGSHRQKLLRREPREPVRQRAETRTSDGDAEQRAQPPDVEQRLARIKRALSATSGANDAATEMATSGANAVAEKRAEDVEKRLSRIKRALSVFSEALDDEPESDVHTPPRKMVKLDEKRFTERHPASCKIWATALKTPPLPCARGGIKKHCETHDVEQEHGSASGRALTGPNVRTTLRVLEPSSRKRTSWCEVRLKESKEHERIVRRVAAAVKSGTAVSKTAAQQLKDELVANSCAQGIMAIRASVHVSCWLSKEKRVDICRPTLLDTSCHCGRKRTPTMCHEVRSLTPTMCSNSTLLIPCHAPSTYTTYDKSCVPMFNPIVRRPTWQIRRCTVHAGSVACFKLFYTRPIHMKVVSTARRREIEEEEHECRKGKRKNGARKNCGLPSIDVAQVLSQALDFKV